MASPDTASLLVGLLLLFHTWGGWASVEVNMEGKVEVYLGETAQITCMFTSSEGVGGRILQWFYVTESGEEQRIYYQDSMGNYADQNTRFTDRISVNSTGDTNVVLTIRDVTLKDEVDFICSISTFTGESGKGRTKLRVFKPPKDLTIKSGEQTGISVNEEELSKIGTCNVKNGYPKPNVTWYRNRTPLRNIPDKVNVVSTTTTESTGLFSIESDLFMRVVEEDKDSEFYCEVVYFVPGATNMIETDIINITVLYPHTEVNIWVESPKGKIKEGDTVELQCDGNGNLHFASFAIKRKDGQESSDSNVLVLNNVTRLDSGEYVCTTYDLESFSEITNSTRVFVHYLDRAVVTPKGSIVVAQGGELEATCNALSSALRTDKAWFKNGAKISNNNTLRLKDATFDTAGTYVCVVTVPEIDGMETTGTLDVHVKGPPQIMGPDVTQIESFETVDLTCNVRGYPVPKVFWTPTGQVNILSEEATGEGLRSVAQVTFNSDITVFCNAVNVHGNHSVAFDIKAILPTAHTTTTPTTATTTPATTTTTTSATTTTTATITNSNNTATTKSPQKIKKESNGVVIVVIIICLLLLAILGSVLFFLYKKGKICGRSGKKDLSKVKSNKDNIVVEMKSDNTEEAILLGVNGEKQLPSDQ
ncbi:melanoma cell adhesion molecule b isoform X2 [Mugil cephalus]|nr:melanoma cell adhesion molecule b isoform X2 [Mugil cephalus]